MKINGIESMSSDQLRFELQRGARIVCYNYCVSLLVITFRRSSDAYFIPARGKRRRQGTALEPAHSGYGMVGNPVGTDLLGAIAGSEFQGRERSHSKFQCGHDPARFGARRRPQTLK